MTFGEGDEGELVQKHVAAFTFLLAFMQVHSKNKKNKKLILTSIMLSPVLICFNLAITLWQKEFLI